MNPRTLLPNEQLAELITAVSSTRKTEIPEQRQDGAYMGAWHELDRQARETAQIANNYKRPNEPPGDGFIGLYMAVVVLILIVIQKLLGGAGK